MPALPVGGGYFPSEEGSSLEPLSCFGHGHSHFSLVVLVAVLVEVDELRLERRGDTGAFAATFSVARDNRASAKRKSKLS